MEEFVRSLQPNDIALFYFSGHGAYVNECTYLLPVDWTYGDYSTALSLDDIIRDLRSQRNVIHVLLLDCCRVSRYGRKSVSLPTLKNGCIQEPKDGDFLIAYATAAGKVACESEERNSVFTKCLLPFLIQPGLMLEQIMRRTKKEVVRYSEMQDSRHVSAVEEDIVLSERYPICPERMKGKTWTGEVEWTPTERTRHEFQYHKGGRCAQASDASRSKVGEGCNESECRSRIDFTTSICRAQIVAGHLYMLRRYWITTTWHHSITCKRRMKDQWVYELLIYDISNRRCCHEQLLRCPYDNDDGDGGDTGKYSNAFIQSLCVTGDRMYVLWSQWGQQ